MFLGSNFWRWLAAVIKEGGPCSSLLDEVKFVKQQAVSTTDVVNTLRDVQARASKLNGGLGRTAVVLGRSVPMLTGSEGSEKAEWDALAAMLGDTFTVQYLPLHLPFWSVETWVQQRPMDWVKFTGGLELTRFTGLLDQQVTTGGGAGEPAWWKSAFALYRRADIHPYHPATRELAGFTKLWEPYVDLPIEQAESRVLKHSVFKR